MSAAATDLRQQRARMRRLARAGAVAALSCLATFPACAEEALPTTPTRLASIGDEADAPLSRLGFPVRPAIIDADLRVLLARSGSAAKVDAQVADDTILVALAATVPPSADEEIAKQYGLELVDRTELPELGLRIVQFRLPAGKELAPVLAELRADERIRRAQRNSRYEPTPPATEPAPPMPRAHAGARPSEVDPAATVPPQPKALGAADKRPALSPRADVASRAGNVGDVLSGGL